MNVYIHIPFCKTKCPYCAFIAGYNIDGEQEYVDGLVEEIKRKRQEMGSIKVETIYFGGGTPSMLSIPALERIIGSLRKEMKVVSGCEITQETNPDDLDEDKCKGWLKAGINRISMGVQSLNNEVLNFSGRHYEVKDVIKGIKLLRKVGFSNISVDFMRELPKDDYKTWTEFREVLGMVDHVSFYDWQEKKGSLWEGMELLRGVFGHWDEVFTVLEECGLKQYEIYNFAKEGYKSRHNYDFWLGKDYLGLGIGAGGKINDEILSNSSNLESYYKGQYQAEEIENPSFYRILVGLRLIEGVKESVFDDFCGVEAKNRLIKDVKNLELKDGKIVLNKQGIRDFDGIMQIIFDIV